MNARHSLAIALLACMPLVACTKDAPPPAPTASTQEPQSAIGRAVSKEIRKAREKLATENISLNHSVRFDPKGGVNVDIDDKRDPRPKAEITPAGDLLIDGKTVSINNEQRALLLEHRAQIIGIAESGMEIGVQGADLAAQAMGEALKGIFSGKSEQEIEKSVEAQASQIKTAAAKLCDRLPAMVASQQKLATALPEFKPYATMAQGDIDDCMKDTKDGTTQAQVQSEIRNEIRSTIRETVRGAVRRDDAMDAAAEANAEANAEATTKQ